jgi:purine-binding chemotaxis protein CheW
MKPRHLVCFRIGKETFGADIFSVREIVRVPEITHVPGAPSFVLGVINLRGRIISVVDLGQRLGLAQTASAPASRILVVNLNGVTVGFLVDAATEVMKLSEEAVEPTPQVTGSLDADYLEGVGKVEDRLILLLDLQKVLSPAQRTALGRETVLVEGARPGPVTR